MDHRKAVVVAVSDKGEEKGELKKHLISYN
jgi:hypothetical protein